MQKKASFIISHSCASLFSEATMPSHTHTEKGKKEDYSSKNPYIKGSANTLYSAELQSA